MLFGALALVLVLGVSAARANPDAPTGLVEAFNQTLLDVMKHAKTLGVRGRYDKLLPAINKTFHIPLMAYFVTGPYWGKATKEQRHALIGAAERMSAGELAVLFDDYDGETFEIKGTRMLKDSSTLVETLINRRNDPPVKVDYRLRSFKSGWRVIDVILDGSISQLVKRKGEYAAILEKGGVARLTATLNAKADEILKGK